jgi:hypothetical protein
MVSWCDIFFIAVNRRTNSCRFLKLWHLSFLFLKQQSEEGYKVSEKRNLEINLVSKKKIPEMEIKVREKESVS